MFSNSGGLFGLADTGFGRFISNAGNTIGDVLERGASFVGRLPNELIDLGENLGQSIFSSGRTQQELTEQGREFQARRAGSSIGQTINQNFETIALFGALAAAVVILSGK